MLKEFQFCFVPQHPEASGYITDSVPEAVRQCVHELGLSTETFSVMTSCLSSPREQLQNKTFTTPELHVLNSTNNCHKT